MNKFINRFYGIGLLIAMFIAISIFSVFKYFDTHLSEEVSRSLNLKSDYIAALIEHEIQEKALIVDNSVMFIESNEKFDEQHLLHYFRSILNGTENLESIYFGSKDNQMINGSGWIPPKEFDLRLRPWYIKATEQKARIITDVFLNASKDKSIITIAKPVYDSAQTLIGVVGADLSMDTIVNLIEIQNESSGYAFLLDGKSEVVAYSEGLKNVNNQLSEIAINLIQGQKIEFKNATLTTISGERGYVLLTKIEGTDLILGTFISTKVFSTYHNQWTYMLLFTIFCVLIFFTLIYILQKKIILKPLISLDQEIKRIAITEDVSYRLTVNNNDPFEMIRQSINQVLNETEKFLEELKYNHEELEASNEELAATLGQLKAYEVELQQQQNYLLENKSLLEASEKRNKAIISVLPDIIFVYDDKGTFIDCQTSDKSSLMLSRENFIGKSLLEIMPSFIADQAITCIKETLATDEVRRFEYQLTVNEESRYFETRMVKSSDNQVLAIVRDITIEKREQDFILELSYKDHLTGLYNRRYFEETLEKMDRDQYLPLAIVMIDVNGLKLTNDAFGHLTGDKLLKKVANTLIGTTVQNGCVARIGGDEFVMVCPNTGREQAEELIDQLYKLVEQEQLDNIVISISAGWEVRENLEQTIRDTFIKAENHMFRKKLVESQSMRNKTIQVIMQTLNEKSEREKRHSVQVSEWAKKIGEAMCLNPQVVKEIETAGLVHDIGKIAVREEVLNKPGQLTEEEYDEIKKHSESGYQILKSVDAYSSLAEDVLAHHERFDGHGYPRGLKGEQIPLIGRIICIADAYEAMISDRSYRKGMAHESALAEIIRCSGTQFDPTITQAFISLFDQ